MKGLRGIHEHRKPAKNSQESVLIERKTHLIWVEAMPVALMFWFLTIRIIF